MKVSGPPEMIQEKVVDAYRYWIQQHGKLQVKFKDLFCFILSESSAEAHTSVQKSGRTPLALACKVSNNLSGVWTGLIYSHGFPPHAREERKQWRGSLRRCARFFAHLFFQRNRRSLNHRHDESLNHRPRRWQTRLAGQNFGSQLRRPGNISRFSQSLSVNAPPPAS